MVRDMIGQVVGQYRIVEKVGEGGMGVVYRAEDVRLGRSVALKFLSPELTRDVEARRRFVREAQAASALDHPNICVIYQVGETEDGHMYIVMPYYRGETLEAKLGRGPLDVAETIELAEQIGRGLTAAHSQGIVHRDLKPGNLIVTPEGVVKILDFGLAKLGDASRITRTGTILGTVAYMAPEQVRGEEVDARADIWALGVVLYEMLTGRLPFPGEHPQTILFAILHEEPRPVERSDVELPSYLETVLKRALAKQTDERFATMEAFIDALTGRRSRSPTRIPVSSSRSKPGWQRVALLRGFVLGLVVLAGMVGGFLWSRFQSRPVPDKMARETAAGGRLKRLVVLPFANIRPDASTDYLGFALADQIISSLTYFPDVLVRPSTTIRRYVNRMVDTRTVGKELAADYVLTGNYLLANGKIRLNVELVDVKADAVLWRRTIDVAFEDAFSLQDLVTRRVVTGLTGQWSEARGQFLRTDVPRHPRAYDAYLRALAQPVTIEGHMTAFRLLEQAIRYDPEYAPAYSEMGYRQSWIAVYLKDGYEWFQRAERNTRRAIALNENLPSALAHLALLNLYEDRAAEAFELLQRLMRINANYAHGRFILSMVYRYTGLLEEARREAERAVALDPGNPRFRTIAVIYRFLGEYEKALEWVDLLDPESPFAFLLKGYVYFLLGREERALANTHRLLAMKTLNWATSLRGQLLQLAILGQREKARQLLRDLPERQFDGLVAYSWTLLSCLAEDRVMCLRNFERTVELGFYCYPLFQWDPPLDLIRDEPEFRRIMERARQKHEAFRRFVESRTSDSDSFWTVGEERPGPG